MTTGKRPLVVDGSEETIRKRQRPRVVIIGGGFAGLQAVRALRDADVDVLLLDRAPYTTFQPLLYQVATGRLNAGDITGSYEPVLSHTSHRLVEVVLVPRLERD